MKAKIFGKAKASIEPKAGKPDKASKTAKPAKPLATEVRRQTDILALEPTIRELAIGRKPLTQNANGQKIWGYTIHGHAICGAQKRNKPGQYCKRKDIRFPSGRCDLHGGLSKSGAENGRFKTGRYISLPEKHQRVLTESYNDPNQTSMRLDIAATDVRIAEISEILGGIDPDILRSIFSQAAKIKLQLAGDYDAYGLTQTVEPLLELCFELSYKEQNWHELQRVQRHRALLAKVENERTQHEETQIPVTKVAALFVRFGEICQDHLTEHPEPLAEIERELAPILRDFFPRAAYHPVPDDMETSITEDNPALDEETAPFIPEDTEGQIIDMPMLAAPSGF